MSLAFGSISGLDKYRADEIADYRRTMRTDTTLHIAIKSKNPNITFNKDFVYDILVPESETDSAEILLIQTQPTENRKVLYSRLSEIEAAPKQSLAYRLDQWAKTTIEEVVSDFSNSV